MLRGAASCATLSICLLLVAGCGGGSGSPGVPGPTPPPTPTPTPTPTPGPPKVVRISSDPFVNTSSQHATQVEPSVFASGMNIVAAFQSGRFFNAGSSDIGFATSHDGGFTWMTGFLPSMTTWSTPAGLYDSVSDPAVAFDAKHAVWLIASLPILFSPGTTPAALVSRSADGLTWGGPVAVAPGQSSPDKGWITCDSTVASPHYGNCYVQWDAHGAGNLIQMSTSTDGGMTWGAVKTAGGGSGIGGQPLVQASGKAIVPIDDATESSVLAFTSTDGGASWSNPSAVSAIVDHAVAGGLRTGPLPSAAIDAGGKVYVVWQDCSFRIGCASNDIVMSTSSDGSSWTAPSRIPIDATSSGVDHFIPGIGVDPATMGASAHLGLTYYFYPAANCTATTCQLFVGFIASQDGGATWGAPMTLAGPANLSWLAQTSQGVMVGDYIATAFSGGHPYGVFAVAGAAAGPVFNEAMYAPMPGILSLLSMERRSSAGERPVPGVRADPGAPRLRPPIR